ncbi:MAG: hypothetical protein ACREBF_01520 [Candidatus Micrarchaeales archaeon]
MIFQPILFLNSCLSSVGGFLGAPLTGWFPFAFFGVLAVMLILAMIYALSPIMGRSELRNWTRLKMYETAFAFLLVILFGSFATLVCTANPVSILGTQSVNLVPNVPGQANCVNSVNIYALSECDLYSFNNNIVSFLTNIAAEATFAFSVTPDTSISVGFIKGVSGVGIALQAQPIIAPLKFFAQGAATTLGSLIILSQVQLLLLDASMLIFAILMPLGLIARIFGVTRSFGGAMIAFAFGLGIVFPIMVALTYGFLVQVMNSIGVVSIQNIGVALFFSPDLGNAIFNMFEYIGMGIVGTLILPLITFTIVNTFIQDFSQAVGERMDFLSLLTAVA